MADRKSTPDVLGSLLGGDTEPPKKPADQNTIKTEYHNTGTPEYHKDGKPVKQPTSKPARQKKKPAPIKEEEASEDKIKATYYISTEIAEALEDGWIQLRRISPKDSRGQVSKSLIVELALQEALDELKSKGKDSRLGKKVSK